jgi:hypothetical protein
MIIIIIIIITTTTTTIISLAFHQDHRLSTSSFHFLLSLAIDLNSLQLLFPASVNVLLHQLLLGLPVFLEPCGFHTRGAL